MNEVSDDDDYDEEKDNMVPDLDQVDANLA